MSHKQLGKIKKIRFGMGGYDDAMIGVTFQLGGEGWGTGDFWGHWSHERSKDAKWSEEDRLQKLGETTMKINALMRQAKAKSIDELEGVPIEATFESPCGKLVSWRILTEVI